MNNNSWESSVPVLFFCLRACLKIKKIKYNMKCQYRDSLGKPGVGFHEARIGTEKINFALWDTVGTIIIILCLIFIGGYNPLKVVLSVSVLTVAIHWFFCVDTTSNKLLGLDHNS